MSKEDPDCNLIIHTPSEGVGLDMCELHERLHEEQYYDNIYENWSGKKMEEINGVKVAPDFYTLGEVDWEDLEIGDVAAFRGCWTIITKTAENKLIVLDCDVRTQSMFFRTSEEDSIGKEFIKKNSERFFEYRGRSCDSLIPGYTANFNKGFYKLPKSMQKRYLVE